MHFRRYSKEGDIPFRIRIGVTGHRHLHDTGEISARIRQVLKEDLWRLFDSDSQVVLERSVHTPVSFTVVTPLAEGADRLVAKTILEFEEAPDPNIEVVLPMLEEDYLKTFDPEQPQDEFHELLARARRPITMRDFHLSERYSGDELTHARHQAYRDVGKYVVDHCDLLIAIWDHKGSRGQGGTAEIVEYAQNHQRPVIVVSTEAPHAVKVLHGGGMTAAAMTHLEAFNSRHWPEDWVRAQVEKYWGRLFSSPEGDKLPAEAKQKVKDGLLPWYVKASAMAKENQNWYRRAGMSAYIASAVAVFLVAIGIGARSWPMLFFVLELVLLSFALGLVVFAKCRKAHERWLEYRFLAERLRSAVFFAVCGVEASRIELSRHIFTAGDTTDWPERVFDEIWRRRPVTVPCGGGSCRLWGDYIAMQWLEHQIRYHDGKAKSASRWGRVCDWSGKCAFLLAIVAAFAHCLHWLPKLATVLAIGLPGVGSMFAGIHSLNEYSRINKRSENMVRRLRYLKLRLSALDSVEELEKVLTETEEIMVHEAQEWVVVMRFAEVR